mmetsp:Transcript_38601/g.114724  ORF Transcript_38601/g.114724 Transcript_38601/m.114724 type:complete len:423 (+) Transcript_38601:383-1651(+)
MCPLEHLQLGASSGPHRTLPAVVAARQHQLEDLNVSESGRARNHVLRVNHVLVVVSARRPIGPARQPPLADSNLAAMRCRLHDPMLVDVNIALVTSEQPLEHLQETLVGDSLTHVGPIKVLALHLVATIDHRPLEDVHMPAVQRLAKNVARVPWARVLASPLQRSKLTRVRGPARGRLVPLAPPLSRPAEDVDVATRRGRGTRALIPRAPRRSRQQRAHILETRQVAAPCCRSASIRVPRELEPPRLSQHVDPPQPCRSPAHLKATASQAERALCPTQPRHARDVSRQNLEAILKTRGAEQSADFGLTHSGVLARDLLAFDVFALRFERNSAANCAWKSRKDGVSELAARQHQADGVCSRDEVGDEPQLVGALQGAERRAVVEARRNRGRALLEVVGEPQRLGAQQGGLLRRQGHLGHGLSQ